MEKNFWKFDAKIIYEKNIYKYLCKTLRIDCFFSSSSSVNHVKERKEEKNLSDTPKSDLCLICMDLLLNGFHFV